MSCVFCRIVDGMAPVSLLAESASVLIFTPLEPAVPGHALVVPKRHVESAATDPQLAGDVFAHAVRFLGQRQGNVLTSVGAMATQTVQHLHVHVIPRGPEDGVHEDWPWHRPLYDGIRR